MSSAACSPCRFKVVMTIRPNEMMVTVSHLPLPERWPARSPGSSALIDTLAGAGAARNAINNAAIDVRVFGSAVVPPADVADLCRPVADIPGTDLPGFIARLSPDPETAERALRGLIAQARALATSAPSP